MSNAISRYPVPELNDLPSDIKEKILQVQEKAGFIPNVFITLAHRPDEFRAFFAYHDALMLRDSGLTKAEREMIVVATSGVNHCQYCVIAHGAILRIYAKNPRIADQVGIDHRKADITPRQIAMLDFACKLARTPEAMAALAVIAGCLAVTGGLWASLRFDTPAGPSIVVAASAIFALSIAFRPRVR